MTSLTRRSLLVTSAAGLALAACAPSAPKPDPAAASAALKSALDALSIAMLKESPEYATALAVSEEQAGGPFKNRLSDYSRAGLDRAMTIIKDARATLGKIDRAALPEADAVSLDVVAGALDFYIPGEQFGYGTYGVGPPQPYVVTQLGGAFTAVPDFLASQHQIKDASDAQAYLDRLAAFAGVLDQETARIAEDAGKSVVPPDFAIDGAVKQLGAFAALAPAKTVLVSSLAERVNGLADLDAAAKADLVKKAEAIVKDQVLPAYRRQIDAFGAIRGKAVSDAGVWRLPRGEELYGVALAAWTTEKLNPEEVHTMGLELGKSLTAEMDALLKAQGLTRGTVSERVRALSKRPDQLYPNTDKGRAQLLADLNKQMEAVTARMPEQFGAQAKAKLEIKRVPEYIEAGAPGGYYQSPALDGSRPGAYYINLRNTAEWPKFTLPTLTYHEGTPGHHWQSAIAQESGELPFIRSSLLWFSGYGEGWALYAEQLADEIGLYADNPLGKLGYLQSAAFRAARLVVDSGMHAKKWTRDQAINYMLEATGDQRSSIVTEVERYSVWPGQACAYMVGRQVINRLREESKTALGAKFDIKGFHDAVLKNGAMPLSTLEAVVKSWVAQQQAKA